MYLSASINNPVNSFFQQTDTYTGDKTISPLAFARIELRVGDLFGRCGGQVISGTAKLFVIHASFGRAWFRRVADPAGAAARFG
jgi:hypothetical protein